MALADRAVLKRHGGQASRALAVVLVLSAHRSRQEPVQVQARDDQVLRPLSTTEIEQATAAVRAEDRVRAQLTDSDRVETILVERHEEDKDAPERRRADIVLYDYRSRETISAIVTLGPDPTVEDLSVTSEPPLALGPQEVEEARRRVLSNPEVQAALREAGMAGRESELLITHIRAQAAARDDPCFSDRCILFFFNTADAVLPIEPVVNLNTGEVDLQ